MRMRYGSYTLLAILIVTLGVCGGLVYAQTKPSTPQAPLPSYDRSMDAMSEGLIGPTGTTPKKLDFPSILGAPPLLQTIEGFDFDDNGMVTGGWRFIPPDPIAAAGPLHIVNIGNVSIQWHRTSDGVTENLQSLNTFFAPLGPPLGTWTFDPKVIYDQHENRFVVVTLEQTDTYYGEPADASRILIAVSKTHDPNAGWWYHSINSNVNIGGTNYWADYPGFAVCDKAVYVTANMFSYGSTGGAWGGPRLWIVDKGTVGGFYAGGGATVTLHDPYAGGGNSMTTQPTHMFGTPPGIMGTFLVGYSGLTYGGPGGNELLQVTRVDDPLGGSGGPYFSPQYVNVGDIENVGGTYGWPSLPDAPQLGGPATIEVNDRRCLHAVWRNNKLVTCSTIIPNSGPDINQTTAHWWQLNTTNLAVIAMADQGDVGAEDLGTMTYTFFPSVAIDHCDNIGIGFSASNEMIWAGAYYTGRKTTDPVGTVQPTATLAAGLDYYYRAFGGTRNRWGDYSGTALCPFDQATFWIYNEYAILRGTPIGGEDGRWGTRAGSFAFDCPPVTWVSLTCPLDYTIPAFSTIPQYTLMGFTITNASAAPMSYGYSLSTVGPGALNDCNANSLFGTTPVLAPGATYTPPNACIDFPEIRTSSTQTTTYTVWPTVNTTMQVTCDNVITIDPPIAAAFQAFEAFGGDDGVRLLWEIFDGTDVIGYNVYRSKAEANAFEKLNKSLLPVTQFEYVDNTSKPGMDYTYKIGAVEPTGEIFSVTQSARVKLLTAQLEQNVPNPFNPVTEISFVLPSQSRARIDIYDARGKMVRRLFDDVGSRGINSVTWDGTNNHGHKVGSGVFYYKLTAGKFTETRKMVIVK